MSEEKIWVEDDILIISLSTQENTNIVEEPNLSKSGCETGSWRVSTRNFEEEKDSLMGSNWQHSKMQKNNVEINFQTLSITSLSECS